LTVKIFAFKYHLEENKNIREELTPLIS